MTSVHPHLARRAFIQRGGSLLAMTAITGVPSLFAQDLAALEVAAAGAMRQMLEGPLKAAAAQSLKLNLRIHSQGADTVARSLVDGSLRADLFIPITASPMDIVMRSGKIATAAAIARTELVLLYSPKSRFLAQFESAANGNAKWWQVLQQPGIRIARSNPANDPSGRAIYFMMMLAARKYGEPQLVQKVLGEPLNPAQVLAGGNPQAMLKSGELDAMCVYKTGPSSTGQPYISLAPEINLSRLHLRVEHPDVQLIVGDKTFYPEPLVFYAGILKDAPNPSGAAAFLAWLKGVEAQALFRSNHFDPPGEAVSLHA